MYPSGHSCIPSARATVVARAFPENSDPLQAMVVEAGLSRNYEGLHYTFDCVGRQQPGRNVANYVLSVMPSDHSAIPLD